MPKLDIRELMMDGSKTAMSIVSNASFGLGQGAAAGLDSKVATHVSNIARDSGQEPSL